MKHKNLAKDPYKTSLYQTYKPFGIPRLLYLHRHIRIQWNIDGTSLTLEINIKWSWKERKFGYNSVSE